MSKKAKIISVRFNQPQDYTVFKDIYKLYRHRLYMYACKFVSNEEAEDIVQDAFVYIWNHRENLDYTERFFYYLLRMVHNGCINQIKKNIQKAGDTVEEQIQMLKVSHYTTDFDSIYKKLYDDELRAAIEEAVNGLPQRCKEIFKMSYYKGMKTKEIASLFCISNRTVEAQIYKALKVLRMRLQDFYEDYKKNIGFL